VVTNCILVLNEIMADSGGMALNRAVMLHLLNRIHEFSEFGILSVLDLVPRYIPANDEGKEHLFHHDPYDLIPIYHNPHRYLPARLHLQRDSK
jgi:hypothetical protein